MKIPLPDISIDRESVLRAAGCAPESAAYPFIAAEYEEYIGAAAEAAEAAAWISFDTEKQCADVVVTAGGGISELSSRLFDEGRAAAGLLVSVMGDEYVFAADRAVFDIIKKECAVRGLGIKKRLEAPADIPIEMQKEIAESAGADVSVTEGMQFIPEKTLAYRLELTGDTGVFNAQHDCSKCGIRDCPRRAAAVRGKFEVLAGGGFKSGYKGCALCVDIGTTTVAAALVDGGNVIQSFGTLNPQRCFGADVVSRIDAAERGRLAELGRLIRFEIAKLISSAKKRPDKLVISANTAMVFFLTGRSCAGLARYPFLPEPPKTEHTATGELGINADIPVTIIGGISAFVGGDIASGIYYCGMAESKRLSLFADLGTNAEMALGNSERLLVTSAAAGPAFEGGGISCGCGSVEGAVCGVNLAQGVIKTIGSAPPCGICGTGITELVSELVLTGAADKTGLLAKKYFDGGYPLTEGITFTQKDMRAFQTAKSAVVSGIETLLHEYGARAEDISDVYLAGGFGNGLEIAKAERIGLLPKGASKKAKVIGNGSLGGAVKFAGDPEGESAVEHIKSISTDILLGGNEYFAKRYIENMEFM